MSFRDLSIKKMYRTKKCNIINEFFIPILNESLYYKRAVGFFTSSALYELAEGITGLVKNQGKIQLIVSPRLTAEDLLAINDGYALRTVIENRINSDFDPPKNARQKNHLNLLANLIAEGTLDIKVAFMPDDELYHEKIGIAVDKYGNKLAFNGSNNETYNAFCKNFESFDVFDNWSNEENIERTQILESAFISLWMNNDDCVEVIAFPKLTLDKIEEYREYPTEDVIRIEEHYKSEALRDVFFRPPKEITFYDYQEEAVNNWFEEKCRGIFDMATGSGKTYTALYALSELSVKLKDRLAVVIVAPYQHLVEQWVEDIEKFGVNPIIAYSNYRDWDKKLNNAVNGFNVKARKHFCVITTNSTFMLTKFQNIIGKVKNRLCFVADEAHNLGAEYISKKLPQNAKYRLALSATIERHRDEEGTQILKDYFGEICQSFTLKDAIDRGFLSPYKYYPILVTLQEDELERYNILSEKIANICKFANEADLEENEELQILLIKRARIIAGAKNKLPELLKQIEKYRNDNHILVYCGATKYDRSDVSDNKEIRQIEEITKQLYEKLGFMVRKFTASESKKERQEIIGMFVKGDSLQVITAIKCLDEGVNIPSIKTAFILASSTNPKEYIQRRGRVLRKSPNKKYAEIYDFVTVPRSVENVQENNSKYTGYECSLIEREMERVMDFAETAMNPLDSDNLKDLLYELSDAYSIKEDM